MKKGYVAVVMSLVIVLCLSFGCTILFSPLFSGKDRYKPSENLTASIEEGQSVQDIAKIYKQGCVAVLCETKITQNLKVDHKIELGSAVCVASIGYSVNGGEYKVSKGSYFVTNYHVVSYACDEEFSNYTTNINIVIDNGEYTSYPADVIWSNRELDMAVLYSSSQIDGLKWIEYKDRSINVKEEDKLMFDKVFTLGTPLSLNFLNTLSIGYVSNTYPKMSNTIKNYYYIQTEDEVIGSSNKFNFKDPADERKIVTTQVIENVYENLIMINLDITHGNSGGGLFDEKGYLIGLTTCGLDSDQTNGAQLNFATPIYPLSTILDRLILANETNSEDQIITYKSLGLSVCDYYMISATLNVSDTKTPFYYIDGHMMSKNDSFVDFEEDGVYICANYNTEGIITKLEKGKIITSIANNRGLKADIKNRNDLIFYLLNCKKGDIIEISFAGSASVSLTI